MVNFHEFKEYFCKNFTWILFVATWAIFYGLIFKVYNDVWGSVEVAALQPEIQGIWFVSMGSFVLNGVTLIYLMLYTKHRNPADKDVEE